ncbi:unnamed protein product [Amoebophrya sp. A120]|nr:unnamed protein product [Amoebophrya sp. A120]|eukprot:GSA120T00021325001.1
MAFFRRTLEFILGSTRSMAVGTSTYVARQPGVEAAAASTIQPLLPPCLYRIAGTHPWVQLQGYLILPPDRASNLEVTSSRGGDGVRQRRGEDGSAEVPPPNGSAILVDPPDADETSISAVKHFLQQKNRTATHLLLTHNHLVQTSDYAKWQRELGGALTVVATDVEIGKKYTHELVLAGDLKDSKSSIQRREDCAPPSSCRQAPVGSDNLKRIVETSSNTSLHPSREERSGGRFVILKNGGLPAHKWFPLFESVGSGSTSTEQGSAADACPHYKIRVSAAVIPGHRPGHLAFLYEHTEVEATSDAARPGLVDSSSEKAVASLPSVPGFRACDYKSNGCAHLSLLFGGDTIHPSSEPFAEEDVRKQVRSVAWMRDSIGAYLWPHRDVPSAGESDFVDNDSMKPRDQYSPMPAPSAILCTHGDHWIASGVARLNDGDGGTTAAAAFRAKMTEHLEGYKTYRKLKREGEEL